MKVLIDGLLPRLFANIVEGQHFLCVPHEGKSDLDRSIPRKLSGWREPGVRFVIVRDTDGADCVALKDRLRAMCAKAGRPDTLIRLACQELESWYIGDLVALAAVFGNAKLNSPANLKRYAYPDDWLKPSAELKRLVPSFQKVGGARAMAAGLRDAGSLSRSYQVFLSGMRQVMTEMGHGG